MKKITIVIMALILMLGGCGKSNGVNTISGVDENTQIEFEKEWIQEGAGLSKVVSYKVDKSFKTIKLTVEAYQGGKLRDKQILEGGLEDTGNGASGFIGLYFTDDYKIRVLTTEDSAKREMMTELEDLSENPKTNIASIVMSDIGVDNKKIEVKDGEEYLIAIARISTDPNEKEVSTPDIQDIMEDTTKLNDMPYAVLLKCEFGTEPIDELTTDETPQPPEELENSIPDDENVSLPDNG